jgi:hypothetical protein
MTRLAKSLIAGTALATLTLTPSFAGSSTDNGSQILNGQINLNSVTSTVTAVVDNASSDVAVQSVAAGNVLDVTTMNDTSVTNNQYSSSSVIGSYLGARITDVQGDVNVANQAVCNSASVSTDPTVTAISNTQQCNVKDPSAVVYVDAVNIGGDLSIANSAIGNTFEADSNAAHMPVTNNQLNQSAIVATTTANVTNVIGTTAITGTAVGNSAQIIHYSTE